MFLSLLFFLIFPKNTHAQVSSNFLEEFQPRSELGAGIIGLQSPFYPGAKQSQFRMIPFPFGVYRGEVFRADDEGTRARLIKPTSYEIGISLGFNFAVDSEDTNRRKGMPSLDNIIQMGPRFLFRFLPNQRHQRLNLSLALKGALSTNFRSRFQERGLTIEPELSYWYRFRTSQITFFSSFNVAFADTKFNGYFYDVPSEFSTVDRATYKAKAGHLSMSLGAGFSKDLTDDIFTFVGSSYENLSGSVNGHSPLIETTENFTVIVGFIWLFYESEEKVRTMRPRS